MRLRPVGPLVTLKVEEQNRNQFTFGGGVSGLSAGWWLARSGASVTVLDKGIVGWEASGRNGGGCSHYQSPLFKEEQRLWPQLWQGWALRPRQSIRPPPPCGPRGAQRDCPRAGPLSGGAWPAGS